jgi:hypothetical protein
MKTILLFSLLLSAPLAVAGKCPVQGDLIRWQTALCARQLGTGDCEDPSVSDCVSKLISGAGKKGECEQKKALKKQIDESCKKNGPCSKIPPIVANGCGE